uniref:Uncharacterized protein n=1 Tax=Arundo donax TaxID=35708 RepID=A0A0A9HU10_ARUDO
MIQSRSNNDNILCEVRSMIKSSILMITTEKQRTID